MIGDRWLPGRAEACWLWLGTVANDLVEIDTELAAIEKQAQQDALGGRSLDQLADLVARLRKIRLAAGRAERALTVRPRKARAGSRCG